MLLSCVWVFLCKMSREKRRIFDMRTNKKLKRCLTLVLASVMALIMTVPVSASSDYDITDITATQATVEVALGEENAGAVFYITGDYLDYLSVGENLMIDETPDAVAVTYILDVTDTTATLTVSVSGLSRTGSGFLGAITVTSPWGSSQLRETGVTVTFTRPTHAVTFDLDGGTRTDGGELNQTVTHGGNATPPTATRSGYNFAGWYPGGGYNNVTNDRTITAQWTQAEVAEATTDVPRTGDDTQLPWLPLVMSFLSIGIGATVLILLRKKKKGENNA